MSVIVTVFEAAGLTVSGKKTETMLLRKPNQALPVAPLVIEAAKPEVRTGNAVFLSGLSCQRKRRHYARDQRRHYARDQTTGPTRMGMLQTVQAGAVRCGGCLVHSKGAHAKGRGDGDLAVQMCDANPRQGALR